jgi:Carboxypeptidase regulatory-like domain
MQQRFWRAIVLIVVTAGNFFLLISTTKSAFAQTGKGTIAGRVTDASGAVLQGARVEVLQRNSFVASDAQGEFTFTDLLPGSYTVKVSYVGFQPFSSDVTVASGQLARVDAVLKIATGGEQVTVYGERQSARWKRSIANAPPTTFSRSCRSK